MSQKRITTYILILWVGVIWANSLMPGSISSTQSGFVVGVFSFIFDRIGITVSDDVLSSLIRSIAHYVEFLFLGLLLALRFSKLTFAYLLGTAVLLIDEIIQIFVPGRAFEVKDLLIDSFGLLTGLLIIFLFTLKSRRNRTKSLEHDVKP
jgi:VanZ family protein